MVKRCVNPECSNEFRHMSSGRLYALESESADTRFVWLCSVCAPKMAVGVDSSGAVSVQQPSGTIQQTPPNHIARLRFISGQHRAATSPPRTSVWVPA